MTATVKRAVRETIEQKLSDAFAPEFLRVIDESDAHAGHLAHEGGAGHGGESHFRVKIVSRWFAGKSRIERHRAVNAALKEELAGGVHALAIDVRAPDER